MLKGRASRNVGADNGPGCSGGQRYLVEVTF